MNRFLSLVAGVTLLGAISVAHAPTKNIVEIAAGNKDFSTLVSLVSKAGLAETLSGKGPFTVFAPTNKAFEKVDKATLEAVGSDKELLTKVLLYHVVPGKVTSKDVVKVKKADTALEDATIEVKVKDGKVMLDGNSTVTAVDIMATNGVIHVIDTVLIPSDAELSAKSKTKASGCSG